MLSYAPDLKLAVFRTGRFLMRKIKGMNPGEFDLTSKNRHVPLRPVFETGERFGPPKKAQESARPDGRRPEYI